MRRLAAAAALVAVLVLAPATPSGAIETGEFGIEPVASGGPRQSFQEKIRPGRSTKDAVRVFNKSSRPLTIRLWAEQASIEPDGQVRLDGVSGTARWLRLSLGTVELAPKSERLVPFEVRAPREIGRHTAHMALVAEPVAQEREQVAVLQRLAVLVYAEPDEGAPLRAALGWPLALAAALLGIVAAGGAVVQWRRRAGADAPAPATPRPPFAGSRAPAWRAASS